MGLAAVGAWLYFTITTVLALYDVTLLVARDTELLERVSEARNGLEVAVDSLDRYTREGQGYDLARHHEGRTGLKTALETIRRGVVTPEGPALIQRAQAAEAVYSQAADRAIHERGAREPGVVFEIRDTAAQPAAAKVREALGDLELSFSRIQAFAGQQLRSERDRATMALVVLAALIVVGLFWLLADVNRRILSPCAAAAHALKDLVSGRPPPVLFEGSPDEIGQLGYHFNIAARAYGERGRALEARDIEASVNDLLAVAATVNDLAGFGSKVLEKILEVTGASSAVLYLRRSGGEFAPGASLGGAPNPNDAAGRAEAARAAAEGKPIFVSVDAKTPPIDLFDGRVLPRESIHLPLMYFGQAVGVLALGAAQSFTPRARNVLSAIAPSLAVALANASANERLAEQSRRLTEQNELLEQQRSRIAQTARELQHASALKDRFLAAVSHELRTPMTVILGFTGTLLRGAQGELNPQQKESLERVQRNARLLLGLINDVLDISKIEAGKAEVRRETVSLPALLKQVESDYGETARRKGLTLSAAASPELPSIISDSAKLLQILSNLVGNALKFTVRGSIEVRTERRGKDTWAVVVTDSGIGIPLDEQDAIFEEFRQGESPGHQGQGGTGLGLAIVRKLALLLGGRVSVKSAPGEGSAFTVELPVELPGAPAESLPFPAPAQGLSEGRTVLLVDDDEGVRKLLRYELEPYGLKLLEADSGRVAVEIARARRPDAILLDVLMPDLDGWATLRILKDSEETREIPVVLHSVVDNRPFGFSLGAFDYLIKPLDRDRLIEALSRAGALGPRGHVLIVDDDPDVRRLLEEDLGRSGYKTRSASGGAQALDEIARDRPSAVLLDLIMPEPDGFEVLYRIRENPDLRDLPVIVLTAKDLGPADYRRLNGSALRILQKGADMTRLVRDVLRTTSVPSRERAAG